MDVTRNSVLPIILGTVHPMIARTLCPAKQEPALPRTTTRDVPLSGLVGWCPFKLAKRLISRAVSQLRQGNVIAFFNA